MIELLAILLFPALVFIGALSDLIRLTIPNGLMLALVGAFLVLAPLAGLDWQMIALSCAAGAIVLAGGLALFARGWIGGSDAKFAAAIAVWLGWSHAFDFVLASAILCGIAALAVLILQRIPLPAFVERHNWLVRLHDPNAVLPAGVALAAVALAVFPQTSWAKFVIG